MKYMNGILVYECLRIE